MPTCGICNLNIAECTCPDIDERMKAGVFHPDCIIATKWCQKCDKHWSRCRCETPTFVAILGGKVVDLSGGLRNMFGERIAPDLNAR